MRFSDDQLLQASQAAAEAVKSLRPRLVSAFGKIENDLKADDSVVTELDMWAESEIKSRLSVFDKSLGFLGEEHGAEGDERNRWIIDPIDGTEYFIRGIHGCVNALALVIDDEPVVSVIYDFVDDRLYCGLKGKGATLNDKKIQVSHRSLNRAFIDTEDGTTDMVLARAIKDSTAWRPLRIPVIGALMVAQGLIEGYIVAEGRGGPWDYVPRTLLIKESGGIVTDLDFSGYDYKGKNFIASNPIVHEELKAVLKDL